MTKVVGQAFSLPGLMAALVLFLAPTGSAPAQQNLAPSLEGLFTEGVQALKAGRLDAAEKVFLSVIRQGGKVAFVYNNLGIVYQQRGDHGRAIPQFREATRLQPDLTPSRILLGVSLLSLGRAEEAAIELESAVKLEPRDPRARLQLAQAYQRAGNVPGAVDQFRALRELAPRDPEYAYQLGNVYLKLTSWCLQQMLQLDHRSARLYQTLGENYRVQGRTDLAIRSFAEAAKIDPRLPEIHLALAEIYLEQGKRAEALGEVERELALMPESAAAVALKRKLEAVGTLAAPDLAIEKDLPLSPEHRAQLEQALNARNYTRAETILVEENHLHPKSPQLLKLAGSIFFLDGQYLNAAVAFKKAEKLFPLDDRDRFTLAMAYIALKRGDWARPELEKLAESNPKNPLFIYWLARLDYDDQKFQLAATKLRKSLALDPAFMRAHDNLGLCLEALGEYAEAVQSYQEAIRLNRQLNPHSPWPPLNLGALMLKLDRLEEAETNLRESLRYDPNFPQARLRLGTLLEKQGKLDEAIRELEQAAALDPKSPEPHYALARIYRKNGDRLSSERCLQVFQKLKKDQRPEPPRLPNP